MIVHPEFCPEDGLWRACSLATRSLREMQAALGSDAVIVGYHPTGWRGALPPDPTEALPAGGAAVLIDKIQKKQWTADRVAMSRLSERKVAERNALTKSGTGRQRRADFEQIMDAWASGMSARDVMTRFGFSSREAVSTYLIPYRDKDPRAAVRPRGVMSDSVRARWVADVRASVASQSQAVTQ